MIFILNISRKRNLERTLFVIIHSLTKYKFQQTPIEPGLLVFVCFFCQVIGNKLYYEKGPSNKFRLNGDTFHGV